MRIIKFAGSKALAGLTILVLVSSAFVLAQSVGVATHETAPDPPSLNAPKASDRAYQGFGTLTPGGSQRATVRVTNLNDSGPGSFRDAVSKGNRKVIFEVAGEIVLTRTVNLMGAFLTIDGFTAPSPGITLKRFGLSLSGKRGVHDVIVRGIRIREAGISSDTRETDGIQIIDGAYNVVIDHVSIHGSEDGNLDIGTGSHDVTVSWSILAEPRGDGKNMLIKFNPSRVSLHHNVFVRAQQRNPQAAMDNAGTPATDTTLDMRNNIVWDWNAGYGTLIWYGASANVVNNFYSSPRSFAKHQKEALIVGGTGRNEKKFNSKARVYASGNFSADKLSEDINVVGNEKSPFPAASVDTHDVCAAAHATLSAAGVRPLDSIDQKYLSAISLPACGDSR
jgi:pectate lyase